MISLASALFMYAKGVKQIVFSGIFLGLMVALLIGSNSRAGIIGFVLGFILTVVLMRKSMKRNSKKLGGVLILGICVLFVMNSISDGAVVREIKSLNPLEELKLIEDKSAKYTRIEDIKFGINSIEIVTENESLKIGIKDEDMIFGDGNGNPVNGVFKDSTITFDDEAYSNYRITINNTKGVYTVKVYNQKFDLYLIEDGFRMLSSGGVLGMTEYPDRLEFMDGYETIASSRGYIWSRSIPMLKDTILIGHGPDSYAMVFPQNDYVGKMNAFNNETMIVDKPHNMYIQIGINTGLVSLIALIVLCLMYFIDSMKLYFKRDIVTFLDHIGIGSVVGMVSYLGAGFFNDQVISVAPLFYVLIGIGIAVNDIIKKQVIRD
jgi:hypothetical protein